jgi:hypothetical protein
MYVGMHARQWWDPKQGQPEPFMVPTLCALALLKKQASCMSKQQTLSYARDATKQPINDEQCAGEAHSP